jgi:hypothetical protein
LEIARFLCYHSQRSITSGRASLIQLREIARVFVFLVGLGLAGLFIHLGFITYIADSEIWSVTLANHFPEEWRHHWVLTRPLFYLPLFLANAPFDGAFDLFIVSRVLFILNALAIAVLTYRVTVKLAAGQWPAILATVLLFSHTGFLNQGFRVRSDLIAATCVLFALNAVVDRRGPRALAWRMVLILAATPKAVFHLLPFAVYISREWLNAKARAVRESQILQFIAVIGAAAAVAVAAVLWPLYSAGFDYLIDSVSGTQGSPGYFTRESFTYLVRWVTNNPAFTTIFALRIFSFPLRVRAGAFATAEEKANHSGFYQFALLNAAVMAAAPEKVPFFLASFLPVLSVFAALFFADIAALAARMPAIPASYRRAPFVIALVAVSLQWLGALNFYERNKAENNNRSQKKAVAIIADYLAGNPGANYYDVIGILPKRASIRLFAGPNQYQWNQSASERIRELRPDFVLYVNKVGYLEPGISALLRESYMHFGQGLFARAERFANPLIVPPTDRTAAAPSKKSAKAAKKKPGRETGGDGIVGLHRELNAKFARLSPGNSHAWTLEIRYHSNRMDFMTGSAESLFAELEERRKAESEPILITAVSQFRPPQELLPNYLDKLFRFDTGF